MAIINICNDVQTIKKYLPVFVFTYHIILYYTFVTSSKNIRRCNYDYNISVPSHTRDDISPTMRAISDLHWSRDEWARGGGVVCGGAWELLLSCHNAPAQLDRSESGRYATWSTLIETYCIACRYYHKGLAANYNFGYVLTISSLNRNIETS